MCGRYLVDEEAYADLLQLLIERDAAMNMARGEIFPTNIAPVIMHDRAAAVKWGFPHWKGTGVIINARAETALEKKMFQRPLMRRRCVIPSSGFFEWKQVSGQKKKDTYLLRIPGERLLYMAGMINMFKDNEGNNYEAFVILTTAANASVAPMHDRMPVLLKPDELDRWTGDDGYIKEVLHRPGFSLIADKVHENTA